MNIEKLLQDIEYMYNQSIEISESSENLYEIQYHKGSAYTLGLIIEAIKKGEYDNQSIDD